MTWIRLNDDFMENPKIVDVGPLAGWLYVASLVYAGRNLTDGYIPAGMVERLADFTSVDEMGMPAANPANKGAKTEIVDCQVQRLCDANLWERRKDGYQIHDYLMHQKSKERIISEREAVRERVTRHRKKATV